MIFYRANIEIDLSDVVTARYFHTKKANNDNLKLVVETRNILNFVVNYFKAFDPEDMLFI